MNLLNEPKISFRDFKRALNIRCNKEFGMSYSDLPDIVVLDDYWYEGIEEREAVMMLDGVIDDLREELMPTDNYTSEEE